MHGIIISMSACSAKWPVTAITDTCDMTEASGEATGSLDTQLENVHFISCNYKKRLPASLL